MSSPLLQVVAWLGTALLAFLTAPLWLPLYVLAPQSFTGMVLRWLDWGEAILDAFERKEE